MALVLTLRVGVDFYVDKERYVLTAIESDRSAKLSRPRDGAVYSLTVDERSELESGVFAGLGDRITGVAVRVQLHAPRSKLLLIGDKWRASGGVDLRVPGTTNGRV